MKYYEVLFSLEPCTQDARDILSAMAGEAGFETFEETAEGLMGYVQQTLFDQSVLDAVLKGFPFSDIHISYHVREAEDRDWNAEWEAQGFDPIVVANRLTIHDGRHLPTTETPLSIEIDAHMAFGTGTHETTRMICTTMLELPTLSNHNVLDCGCGTGILGICALKLGAAHCTAYDIDEWCVDNTRHNAVINMVDTRLKTLHGNAALLDTVTERYDLVVANINRNILLEDMPRFVSVMHHGATLVLSGFYRNDSALLESKAETLGLTLTQQHHEGEWACLVFSLQDYS